jgi:DNA integrity scanning protein DisA with diadenylate cyclase activity
VKGKCLQTIIANRSFNKLDRHLRQDIAAIDGATILDYQGNVFAAGAIVQLKGAGSEDGGARKAAAKTLAQYGLAIKISSDGAISGYKKGVPVNGVSSTVEEVFTIG